MSWRLSHIITITIGAVLWIALWWLVGAVGYLLLRRWF